MQSFFEYLWHSSINLYYLVYVFQLFGFELQVRTASPNIAKAAGSEMNIARRSKVDHVVKTNVTAEKKKLNQMTQLG